MSLLERLEVPAAKSRASTSATFSPRVAASSAAPVPVEPAPMTTMSKVLATHPLQVGGALGGAEHAGGDGFGHDPSVVIATAV